ncbi:hypothetical protein XNA1_5110009 [Xenorhabdus nematophila str. Anatoliense]|nr:hypothetical protein XNA1_5110009 [Xenorhabdus nematophila str. Anatoliense]
MSGDSPYIGVSAKIVTLGFALQAVRFGKTRWKGGKRQAGQSRIPNRVDTSQRPALADKRARTDNFEGDTIYGQNAYLVTLDNGNANLLCPNLCQLSARDE